MFAAVCATVGVCLFWGFTVDDALITARVAHHLHEGLGYRFNPSGPIVDAVTPLGWAHALAPFANGPWGAWTAARWLGAVSWVGAAAWLGKDVRKQGGSLWPFALLAGLAPLGAWASAGMETGVVIALATLTTTRKGWGLVPAGVVAALRPELLPYALVLALGRPRSQRGVWLSLVLVAGPALLVAVIRSITFGCPYPLSAVAKPAEFSAGVFYAVQTVVLSGPFWLWPGPGVAGMPRDEKVLSAAVVAHLFAVALVGGDWMVLMRLSAPVLPATIRVAAMLAPLRGTGWRIPGWVGAATATAYLGLVVGVPGRHIVAQRRELIQRTTPMLEGSRVVAGLDVGWLGMAHRGSIVDVAGVTDPTVAELSGGHTSKRIELGWLRARDIDAFVLLLAPGARLVEPWSLSHFARTVESRIARFAEELGCTPQTQVKLPQTRQSYVLVRCPRTRQPRLR